MLQTFAYSTGYKTVPATTFPTPLPPLTRPPTSRSKSLARQYRNSRNPFSRSYSPKKSIPSTTSKPDSATTGIRTPSVPSPHVSPKPSLPALETSLKENGNDGDVKNSPIQSLSSSRTSPRISIPSFVNKIPHLSLIPTPLAIPSCHKARQSILREESQAPSSRFSDSDTSSYPFPQNTSSQPAKKKRPSLFKRWVQYLDSLDGKMDDCFVARKEKRNTKKEKQERSKSISKIVDTKMRAQIATHREREKRRSEMFKEEVTRRRLEVNEREWRARRASRENRRIERAQREKRVSAMFGGKLRIHAGVTWVAKKGTVREEVRNGECRVLGREVREWEEIEGGFI